MTETPYKNLAIGAFIALVSWFCLATTNTLVKFLYHAINPIQILFLQNLFGLIVVALIYLFINKNYSLIKADRYDLLLLRALSGIGGFFFVFIALKHVTVTDATLLMNTGPLFLPLLLLLFFHEPIENKLWLGIIPGFIGIVFILKPGAEIFQWHTLLPLISGLCVAVNIISLRLLYLNGEPIIRILFYLFLFGTVVTFPFALHVWKNPTLHESLFLLLIGVTSFFSQTALTIALRFGSAKALAPLCYTSVVFALIYDRLIWKIVPVFLSVVGMILVILGGIIALLVENKEKKPILKNQ